MTDIESLQAYGGQLAEAAESATASAKKQHEYVNGDSSTDVLTESGPVPSLAKQAVLGQEKVTSALEEVASQLAGSMSYTTIDKGLAATKPGALFGVLSKSNKKYVDIYENVDNKAVATGKSYPSANALEEVTYSFYIDSAGRSPYWGGMATKGGAIGIAFEKISGRAIFGVGGDILARVENVEELTPTKEEMNSIKSLNVSSDLRNGILLGFKTPLGRLLAHFDKITGRFKILGRDILGEIDSIGSKISDLYTKLGNPLADFPTIDWACWGDSLTAPGSSGNWPSKLAASLGVNIYNGGWGGQAYRQCAARQGGIPCLMTVVGGIIPASGGVAVTTNAYYPASNGGSVVGTLAGVLGTYTRAADGLSATFTRTTAGQPTTSPAGSRFTPFYGETMRDRTVVLWHGANSVYFEKDPYDIIASFQPMIDYLTPRVKRIIIMEVPPSANRTLPAAPGSDREKLERFNALLQASYPEYFLDIASWLRTPAAATAAGITFTEQDLIDIANGVTPSSFTTDGLHFSDAGGRAIAYRVKQEAITRGWIV
ncbi:hypothetical protein [Pseudomonas helleri]|uniref:hypothetical protein n=1 Tax=Pseudomonas helleri TaxID=1608996 RepID=UPI0028F0FAE5|nr:hypothetical protein [Pseudomonas helleri]